MRRVLTATALFPALLLGLAACDLPTSWERDHAPTSEAEAPLDTGPQGGPSVASRTGGDAGTLLAEAEAPVPDDGGGGTGPVEDGVSLPHPFDDVGCDHLALGEFALAQGDLAGAVTEYRKAVYDLGTYESLLALGRTARQARAFDLAAEALAGAAAVAHDPTESLVLLARVELARDGVAEGLRAVDKALVRTPDRVDALNVRGRLEMAREQYDRAVQDFQRAVRVDPTYVWAWNNLGYVHLLVGRPEAAVEALEVATRLENAEAYMFNNLGLAYRKTGRLTEAQDAFLAALDRRPGYVNARLNLEKVQVLALAPTSPAPITE